MVAEAFTPAVLRAANEFDRRHSSRATHAATAFGVIEEEQEENRHRSEAKRSAFERAHYR